MTQGEIQLFDPQTLYRHWEDSQWNPFEIDLERDKAQWPELAGEDQKLIYWVLASLMVAEERITTKFSGLVGAYGSEEEATFLSTQQVDEARHMQFYARFQDEVIDSTGGGRRPCRAGPRAGLPRLPQDLRRGAGPGPRGARRRSGRPRREGPLRDHLPPDPREHPRPDHVPVHHRLPRTARTCCPGFVEGYSQIHHDETRHIGYGVWFLRESVREHDEAAEAVRADAPRSPAVGGRGPRRHWRPAGTRLRGLGVSTDEVREFALGGLTRRLEIIGVPLSDLAG